MFKQFCLATLILITNICSTMAFAERVLLKTQPVNNHNVAIEANPELSPNNYRDIVTRYLEYIYSRSDGRINDQFIPYKDSLMYVQSLPHGTSEMIRRNNSQIAAAEEMISENRSREDVIDEYYFMRTRVLAPTLLKS